MTAVTLFKLKFTSKMNIDAPATSLTGLRKIVHFEILSTESPTKSTEHARHFKSDNIN